MKQFEEYLILTEQTENSEPIWFGFTITLKENDKLDRNGLIKFLEDNKIGTRLLFADNILKQTLFTKNKVNYRVIVDLKNTDEVIKNTFCIGVWSGIDHERIKYIIGIFRGYLKKFM